MSAVVIVAIAFLAGAVPFSNIAARLRTGVDLREVGAGTIGGSALFKVAGFSTMAVAGIFDVAKGSLGPLLAGSDRPVLAACAGGAAVIGHNWSPFLRGAGGRGFAPALGVLLVVAWPAAVGLLGGLVLGLLLRQTGLVVFIAEVAIVPIAAATQGRSGALAGVAVTVPMLLKRIMGDRPPAARNAHTYITRLLLDHDPTTDA